VGGAPNQNVGGACCDGLMTKRHHRGRQRSRRSLTPIPTPDPQADPRKISNRYTEEVRWEILLLEPVNDWFVALCKNVPAVADKVEQAIDELAIWGPQLGRPLVDRIHGSKIHNLKELRPRVGGAGEVRLLAGLMLVSAIGRVISLVHNGRPHWFQEVLTAVEFIVPAAFFGLTNADEAK